jgi:hypothetical protein
MSSYNMAASGVGPLTIGQVSQIDIGQYSSDKKLPNKKISIDVHTAYGGYVVRLSKGYGIEDDMYVIGDNQDLGQELGKIITHTFLKTEHE